MSNRQLRGVKRPVKKTMRLSFKIVALPDAFSDPIFGKAVTLRFKEATAIANGKPMGGHGDHCFLCDRPWVPKRAPHAAVLGTRLSPALGLAALICKECMVAGPHIAAKRLRVMLRDECKIADLTGGMAAPGHEGWA